jgi:hypothetical protein
MRRFHVLTCLLAPQLLFIVAACDQSAPTSLQPGSAPALAAVGRGGKVISGAGQYTGGFGITKVAAHAVRHADGTVTGQYEQRNLESGFMMHGGLDCASSSGNRVYVSGTVTNIQNPGTFDVPEGTGFMVVIEDHGEGANASPDRVSPFIYGVPSQSCTDPWIQAFLVVRTDALESGNFQVAP